MEMQGNNLKIVRNPSKNAQNPPKCIISMGHLVVFSTQVERSDLPDQGPSECDLGDSILLKIWFRTSGLPAYINYAKRERTLPVRLHDFYNQQRDSSGGSQHSTRV